MNGPGRGTSGSSACFLNDISDIRGTGTVSVGSSGPSHSFRSYFHQSVPGPIRRPLCGLPSPCRGKESDTEAKITGSDLCEGSISTKSTITVLVTPPDVDPHVDILDCFSRYIRLRAYCAVRAGK
jgi:hypothetical protein